MAIHRPLICLDKSYLQGAKTPEVLDLHRRNTLVMCDALFAELMTTSPRKRIACFSKLPAGDNPVELIAGLPVLLKHEVENQTPCTPLWEHRAAPRFSITSRVLQDNMELNEIESGALERWEADIGDFIPDREDMFSSVSTMFPILHNHRPGADREAIRDLQADIARNDTLICDFYDQWKPSGWPPGRLLNRDWALYVWLAVNLLAAIDYISKYGVGINQTSQGKLFNEIVDLEYTVVAVLARGLASREKSMWRRFALLCPNGILER